MPKTCLSCGLVNPDESSRCDCGQALASAMDPANPHSNEPVVKPVQWIAKWAVARMVGGLVFWLFLGSPHVKTTAPEAWQEAPAAPSHDIDLTLAILGGLPVGAVLSGLVLGAHLRPVVLLQCTLAGMVGGLVIWHLSAAGAAMLAILSGLVIGTLIGGLMLGFRAPAAERLQWGLVGMVGGLLIWHFFLAQTERPPFLERQGKGGRRRRRRRNLLPPS